MLTIVPPKQSIPASEIGRRSARRLPTITVLTNLSPEAQADFVRAAHDAIMAVQVPRLGMPVRDALLAFPMLNESAKYPHAFWLRCLGIRFMPDRYTLIRQIMGQYPKPAGADENWRIDLYELAEAQAQQECEQAERNQRIRIVGLSSHPLAYMRWTGRHGRCADPVLKPLVDYADVYNELPLYAPGAEHQLSLARVLADYQPLRANERQRLRDIRTARPYDPEKMDPAALNAARASAHNLILQHRDYGGRTIRDLLRMACADENSDESCRYARHLYERYGIQVVTGEAPAACVTRPSRLYYAIGGQVGRFTRIIGDNTQAAENAFGLYL
ncbi:hypothetical protein [Propionivibrio dicarboxylicus]|uniref:Uncharacterized protein n=1 Tax=Propionivibrio dicarboxylicus TaxID=83767 RepID=A0A1G8N479_9RHOO|nr:hypothetical protein [Propionivibrio dicarboxylicus]SDI74857.1 hypothetical protein SAMN05660652_03972 [Propionivibrio dicarboxylicus]